MFKWTNCVGLAKLNLEIKLIYMNEQTHSPLKIIVKAAVGTVLGLVIVGVVALAYRQGTKRALETAVQPKTDQIPVIQNPEVKQLVTTTEANSVDSKVKSFALRSGTTLQILADWKIELLKDGATDPQVAHYEVTFPGGKFYLDEVAVAEWLKGPSEDQGYVLAATERATVLGILKDIYANQMITKAMDMAFDKQAGEFFGYSQTFRVGRNYFSSSDNNYRGLSFYNTYGQAPGVSPIYHVSMYNPTHGTVLAAYFNDLDKSPEVIKVNETVTELMKAWEDAPAGSVEKADLAAHESFEKIIESKTRAELSFGSTLNSLDELLKSVR